LALPARKKIEVGQEELRASINVDQEEMNTIISAVQSTQTKFEESITKWVKGALAPDRDTRNTTGRADNRETSRRQLRRSRQNQWRMKFGHGIDGVITVADRVKPLRFDGAMSRTVFHSQFKAMMGHNNHTPTWLTLRV
jgi:hypothetical protein